LQQDSAPVDLYNTPSNLFVADFMGNPQINRLDGAIATENGSKVYSSATGSLTVPLDDDIAGNVSDGQKVALVMHPEWLEVSSAPIANSIEMKVYVSLMAGCETLIFLQSDGISLVTREQGQSVVQADTKAWVTLNRYNLYDMGTESLIGTGGIGGS
ncbi:hypothetical protein KAH43_05065, partial [Candidatus Bipolaricaulota bacterium]|nr:hypothetical protein [Candidatus Bipolaricaulota bacterium]